MKAIIQKGYGPIDHLTLDEVPLPTPGDDEVLVRVKASSVNYGNVAAVKGDPFIVRFFLGFWKPKHLNSGSDIAGVVEAVGKNVDRFQPGDEVYGDSADTCMNAYAEYVAVPEKVLAPKPSNLSFEEAAVVPQAALVALQALRDYGKIESGQKVLVVGASSGIGTFAVQIAKASGAEVTAVCGTRNLEMVRGLGADRVIDYTREDFAEEGIRYDLIIATAGHRSIFDYRRALAPEGRYVATGGTMSQIFQAMLLGPILSMTGKQRLTNTMQRVDADDLMVMKDYFEAGQVKPVIDRSYRLEETAEALGYYAQGHSSGKVGISIGAEA